MSQPLKLLLPATIFATHNNLMSCKTRFDLCVVKCASNRVFRVSPEWALLSTHQECLQVYVHPIKEIINLLSSGFIQLLSDFGWYTQSHSQALMNFSLSHHTNLFKATNHFEKPCFWEGEALGYFDVQVDWFLHCHRCPLPDVLFFDQQKWRELTARHLDKNQECQAQVAVSHNLSMPCFYVKMQNYWGSMCPPPTLQTLRVCNQSLPAYQPWEYRKMTIHSEKVVFLSQLKAHKQNKNLFGAENLNIDSRSFQESKICHKTILFFCL